MKLGQPISSLSPTFHITFGGCVIWRSVPYINWKEWFVRPSGPTAAMPVRILHITTGLPYGKVVAAWSKHAEMLFAWQNFSSSFLIFKSVKAKMKRLGAQALLVKLFLENRFNLRTQLVQRKTTRTPDRTNVTLTPKCRHLREVLIFGFHFKIELKISLMIVGF